MRTRAALAVLALLLAAGAHAQTQAQTAAPAAKPAVTKPTETHTARVPAAAPAKPPAKPGDKPAAPPHAPPVVKPRPGTPGHAATPRRPVQPAPPPPAPAPAPAEPEKPAEPTKGSNTGSPLPRFATLRSDEVNLRTGPGTRYPIDWVYKRRDLPVLIEREFEVWRLIRDPDGIKGWVHQATLAPRRTGVVIAAGDAQPTLRSDPRDSASAIAVLKPGVIVRLRSCEATSDWCQALVQDYRGWVKRSDIWGTFPGEAIQ